MVSNRAHPCLGENIRYHDHESAGVPPAWATSMRSRQARGGPDTARCSPAVCPPGGRPLSGHSWPRSDRTGAVRASRARGVRESRTAIRHRFALRFRACIGRPPTHRSDEREDRDRRNDEPRGERNVTLRGAAARGTAPAARSAGRRGARSLSPASGGGSPSPQPLRERHLPGRCAGHRGEMGAAGTSRGLSPPGPPSPRSSHGSTPCAGTAWR